MAFALLITPAAARDLHRLRGRTLNRVDAAILALRHDPRPAGAKLLSRDLHRIRVGGYRVVYSVRDVSGEVVVARVGHRREIYLQLRRMGLL